MRGALREIEGFYVTGKKYEMVLPEKHGRRRYKVGSMVPCINLETDEITKWVCVLVENGFAAFERYRPGSDEP